MYRMLLRPERVTTLSDYYLSEQHRQTAHQITILEWNLSAALVVAGSTLINGEEIMADNLETMNMANISSPQITGHMMHDYLYDVAGAEDAIVSREVSCNTKTKYNYTIMLSSTKY